MAASQKGPPTSLEWERWLRLQQRLVRRTSAYMQNLAEMIGQGSLEPREYIEQSAKAWAAVVGDVGDWLKPTSDLKFDSSEALVSYVTAQVSRGGSRAVAFEVPLHLFNPQDQDVVVRLRVGTLTRRVDPKSLGRPTLALEPERHLRLTLSTRALRSRQDDGSRAGERDGLDVTRDQRTSVELKVYDLPDTINANEVYEGIIWGTLPDRTEPVPVAIVALSID